MARKPWTWPLRCGCTVTVVDEKGICVHAMFDGLEGVNVRCPEHGWQVEAK